MPLTLDATIGGATSNSYLTVERADELAEYLPHASQWLSDDTLSKEQLLVYATMLIDRFGYFNGTKANSSQALAFPRSGLWYLPEGLEIANNVIPSFIEWATLEWAMALAENSDPLPTGYGFSALYTPSFRVEFNGEMRGAGKVPESVTMLLKPYATRVGLSYARVLRT